jgi:putative ABC transport system ATP-binding protein
MSDAFIRVEGLDKHYQLGGHDVFALRGVELQIREGEFVAVMGPSGSGKSSLMNIIGCLDRPTSGKYWLDGREVSRLSRNELAVIRNRHIGFVFQSYNLLSRMSALENVQLPMVYAGLRAAERHKRAMELLAMVGLTGREHHEPAQLSGGQQQRVAIARALSNRPRLILADEPTGALDSRSGLEIMAILQGLNEAGITVVTVTHEADVAQFAGRCLRFRDGQVVEDCAVEPLNARAALRHQGLEAAV